MLPGGLRLELGQFQKGKKKPAEIQRVRLNLINNLRRKLSKRTRERVGIAHDPPRRNSLMLGIRCSENRCYSRNLPGLSQPRKILK